MVNNRVDTLKYTRSGGSNPKVSGCLLRVARGGIHDADGQVFALKSAAYVGASRAWYGCAPKRSLDGNELKSSNHAGRSNVSENHSSSDYLSSYSKTTIHPELIKLFYNHN
ncbi:MAG: hypothetical protein LBC98_01695 [Prevotellaceae bacterium]|jgi:hypothetical protein|nr:hypothetical protein [Prevotellaceae bacterium]